MTAYIRLNSIQFSGPTAMTTVEFSPGVNVICGASDTGKSFLAEAIDFMLGGSALREIPERTKYSSIRLAMSASDETHWSFARAPSGGDFTLHSEGPDDPQELRQKHAHEKNDNVSGYLLEKIGLLGRRILKSAKKGTTTSLSFRNLARLVIVQEGEIQQPGSPFWGGQYTLKTAELATVKLLLTGIDDSDVVTAGQVHGGDNSKQVSLLDELILELSEEINTQGSTKEELQSQLSILAASVEEQRTHLEAIQRNLDQALLQRRDVFFARSELEERLAEIDELLERFSLLDSHYGVDRKRLVAIKESGSLFAHAEKTTCPLCGATPDHQETDSDCDGNVEAIVEASAVEITKIDRLSRELDQTVEDMKSEQKSLALRLIEHNIEYDALHSRIAESISPQVGGAREDFQAIMEKRTGVQRSLELYEQLERLEERRKNLIEDDDPSSSTDSVAAGLPDTVAHAFSLKVEALLKAWNFPGECRVHYDKKSSDFVIDGKPRGSRGKGLRAITHAAVSLALLEYCQENGLSHPGFVVMDSPLLAYFEPEGEDDRELQGTDLKERFYEYLVRHHGSDSQIIVIENQHPPLGAQDRIAMTVFTGNPTNGRVGLL